MNTSSKKILLVEDELIVASSIAENLEKAGYEVGGIASTGQQALTAVERNRVDLVLMDIRIKGSVDGIQTAHQIHDGFRLPIIFLTAHADHKTIERAKVAEPFGYLVKPVSHSSLVSAIEIALHKHAIDRNLKAWIGTTLSSKSGG
jgi:CheY-like chemotaxis protein